jgi:asparagine synthase (glutamine-hydrolysing)
MCGILGAFAFADATPDVDALTGQVNALAHRGPDAATWWADGPFFFGHRRLSIIDLVEGHQPMATPDARLVVTFNGEIYNYLELRAELADRGYAFQTHSDTEVLLHGYDAWGERLPEHLVGMFAFAIADRARHELFLARDRFGEKPLLVAESPDGVMFASELAPLGALIPSRRLNRAALAGYLCLNYVPGDATLMDGIERLPPASWRRYDAAGRRQQQAFWRPPARPRSEPGTESGDLEELSARLDRAVSLALRSDVPVGVFLSGGMDSSLVAESAMRAGRLSTAYCLAFEEESYSEWNKASAVATRLGLPLTRAVLAPRALEDFLSIVDHADDPLADSSALAVWTLARTAARGNKVVLSGDGGDELFGGYLTYQASIWHGALTARLPMRLRRALARRGSGLPTSETKVSASYKARRFLRAVDLNPAVAHLTWNGVWLPSEVSRLLSPDLPTSNLADPLAALARRHGIPDAPALFDLQRLDIAEYLPNDILAKGDRMTMAHGLELRAPLLEPSLAEFALALPAARKVGARGRPKRLLRALARRTFGDAIADAPKQGFSIPVHRWLRVEARSLVEDLLSDTAIAAIPELNPRGVRAVVGDHISGRRSYGFELWGLMVLSAWHARRIRQTAPRPAGPGPRRVTFPAVGTGVPSSC